MKKKYVKPSIEIIKIKKEDIITTSTAKKATDALFGDGEGGVKLS